MPIWRTWRIGPSASASIASISARIRGVEARARVATLSGVPSPRSAVCSAARPSVTLTTSPANSASRLRGEARAPWRAPRTRRARRRSDASSTSRSGCPRRRALSVASRSGSAANRSVSGVRGSASIAVQSGMCHRRSSPFGRSRSIGPSLQPPAGSQPPDARRACPARIAHGKPPPCPMTPTPAATHGRPPAPAAERAAKPKSGMARYADASCSSWR